MTPPKPLDLELAGWLIAEVQEDHAMTRLRLTNGQSVADLALETRICGNAGEASSWQGLAIERARADPDGTLRVTLSSGTAFWVEPLEDYEAWGLGRTDGLSVYCMPGGELAVFPPAPQA